MRSQATFLSCSKLSLLAFLLTRNGLLQLGLDPSEKKEEDQPCRRKESWPCNVVCIMPEQKKHEKEEGATTFLMNAAVACWK